VLRVDLKGSYDHYQKKMLIEVETGGSQVQDQPRVHIETLFQKYQGKRFRCQWLNPISPATWEVGLEASLGEEFMRPH
jgi:hypothetical protein